MSNYIKVSTIACEYINTDYIDNIISHLSKDIARVLPDKPDLILLPELCDIPVNYRNKRVVEYLYESHDNLLNFFTDIASKHNTNVIWPTVFNNNGSLFNSAFHIDRNGNIGKRYDKIYTTYSEISNMDMKRGSNPVVFDTDFGTVGCIICFDINFKELRDRYCALSPKIMVFPSMFHGSFMQKIWAYECNSYFISSVGGLESNVVSPVGDILARSTNYTNYATTSINLDFVVVGLGRNFEKLDNLKKKYGEKVKIYDPGYLSTALITAESHDITAEDVCAEFGIVKWTDYISECGSSK